MTKYVNLVNLRLGCFIAWWLKHVPRNSNKKANALTVVAASLPIKEIVFLPVYYLSESSITINRVNEIDETGPSSMTPIAHYLISGDLLDNRVEAHKIQVQAAWFSLVNSQLYNGPWTDPILNALLTNGDSTYWQNPKRGYVEITQAARC